MTTRKFTQLTVQPDETALFFEEGKLAGQQGRSTMDGALIPFLGDIVDWRAAAGAHRRGQGFFAGACTGGGRHHQRLAQQSVIGPALTRYRNR